MYFFSFSVAIFGHLSFPDKLTIEKDNWKSEVPIHRTIEESFRLKEKLIASVSGDGNSLYGNIGRMCVGNSPIVS